MTDKEVALEMMIEGLERNEVTVSDFKPEDYVTFRVVPDDTGFMYAEIDGEIYKVPMDVFMSILKEHDCVFHPGGNNEQA